MAIKIAIVDDKASNRNILKDKLLRHGHFEITLIAEDGKDFLEKIIMVQIGEGRLFGFLFFKKFR